MMVLVKIGGAHLEHAEDRATFAAAVGRARAAGHGVVVVHGGGGQIRSLAARLGLEERRVEGLRVTDAPTAEVVLAVLGGQVNRTLVAALEQAGVGAVGLTGADGGTFVCQPHAPGGRDLGYVGRISRVRPDLVCTLLAAGYVPVVAPLAPLANQAAGESTHLYNVNADSAAAPLAAALGVDALIFLTDVEGVRGAAGTEDRPLAHLDPPQAAALEAAGVLAGGMVPKVRAALEAAAALPGARVVIAPASGEGAILAALGGGVGTVVHSPRSAHSTHSNRPEAGQPHG